MKITITIEIPLAFGHSFVKKFKCSDHLHAKHNMEKIAFYYYDAMSDEVPFLTAILATKKKLQRFSILKNGKTHYDFVKICCQTLEEEIDNFLEEKL